MPQVLTPDEADDRVTNIEVALNAVRIHRAKAELRGEPLDRFDRRIARLEVDWMHAVTLAGELREATP